DYRVLFSIVEFSDHDLGGRCFVDGTLVCDLLEARVLLVGELACDGDGTLDAMNVAFFVLRTLRTVFRMDSLLSQSNSDALERPLLSSRVEMKRHRNATAERGKQQRVRIRTSIFTASGDWFICNERMSRAIAHLVAQICLRSYNDLAHGNSIHLFFWQKTQQFLRQS